MGPGALAQRMNMAERLSASTPALSARYARTDLFRVMEGVAMFGVVEIISLAGNRARQAVQIMKTRWHLAGREAPLPFSVLRGG